MPLDKNALKTDLKTAFETSKAQQWTTDQVAQALADAIDKYVRGGDVKQVKVDLTNGNQTGTGKVQ